MAVAVIGGLLTSTLFTLVVIPAVFTMMDDFQGRILRLLGRLKRKDTGEMPPAPGTMAGHGL
jgi:hypothetical protein